MFAKSERKTLQIKLWRLVEMDSSNKRYPDFFKVFLPDLYSENLRIPDSFLHHFSDEIPKKVILRNRLGIWPVMLADTENGVFFQQGWSRLVVDNSLQVGEFLIFRYNGNHIFDFKILGISGCEKELPDQVGTSTSKKKVGGDSKSGDCPERLGKGIDEILPASNPFFVTKKRKSRESELCIPYDVRKDFDLKFSEHIQFQDPENRLWKGKVVLWKDGRVWIKNGWKLLCKYNKVCDDDTLICEFMPSGKQTCEIIKVQIIRSEH